jgi:hypothetical protein
MWKAGRNVGLFVKKIADPLFFRRFQRFWVAARGCKRILRRLNLSRFKPLKGVET